MQQDILIIGVLFPAIPLMMVNFGNRYSVLANLIRHLHDEVIRDNVSPKDAERFLLQISRLRNRLHLIGIIQSCAAISFVLALGAMIAAYFDEQNIRVVSNAEYLPQQVLPLFYRTQRQFTAGEGDAAKHARTVLDSLGDLDIGQSVIVQQRRVLAIEGAEGTNEMIARTVELIDKSQPDTVFVKMAKSGQDIALDMPVFGVETLSYLEKSGIRAVCLEGEKIMLADPLDVISAAADKAGISICTFASLSEKADD